MIKVGTVEDGNGLVVDVFAETLEDGSVQFTVQVVEGFADLRGFFMDVGDSTVGITIDSDGKWKIADESVTSVGTGDNNMNGTGETFDVGIEIGTAGMGRDDMSSATFSLQGISLASIDGLTFGIRATSVGDERDDAVKLLGEFNIPDEPPPPSPEGDFPTFNLSPEGGDDISSILLVYNTGSETDYYVAHVSDVPWYVEDDLDLWLIDVTQYFAATDENVGGSAELVGVVINHGEESGYYAIDGDPGQDVAPAGDLTVDTSVDHQTIYDYVG
jgi:hypothetical protein